MLIYIYIYIIHTHIYFLFSWILLTTYDDRELNEEKGAMQVKLPERGKLKQKYDAHYKPSSNNQTLSKDEFNKIVMEIITFDRFRLGKGALDVIAFLFGVPIGALFAKRFIPRGESVSDDMLIPAVTSLTVFVLAKTNRL